MDDFTPQQLSSLIQITHKFDGSIATPSTADLNYMHWNINRLTNKLHLVEQYVAIYPGILHIIVISETWLTILNSSTYNLNGYYAIHSVRQSNGGGISVFVHESICGTTPKVLIDVVTPDLNQFLVLELPSVNTIIAAPYRRPDSREAERRINTFLDEFEQYCMNHFQCMVMGDLNLNQLDDDLRERLSDVIEMNGFALLNEISTRGITRLRSGTILDLCATNMLRLSHKLSIVHHQSSDHSILFASTSLKVQPSSASHIKSKLNLNGAVRMVEQLCTDQTITCGNELNLALQKIVHDCTSTVTIKSDHRIKNSHVNRELILAIRNRDRLAALSSLPTANDIIVRQYNEAKNLVCSLNEQLKCLYETERFESAAGDARKTWKLYKEIIFNQFKSKTDTTITIRNIPVSDSVASCNAVNDYFCRAGENLAASIISIHGYDTQDIDELYPEHANNYWSFQHVNSEDVVKAIKSLPNKKSTSFDKVPIQLLKSSFLAIALTIATCFNTMVDTSEFPKELLKGRLKLIHKSGSCDIDNFRGLTLLPSLSRVFEELLLRQLYSYLEKLNLFIGNQFGFLKNSSCQSAVLQLVDFIKSNYRRKLVAAMFIDLRKAFDTVDTNRLARKLQRLGLSKEAVKLMANYLQNRQTATTIGNKTSSFRNIDIGVAQGSKLGPLHFVIYINDLLKLNFIGQLLLYADDAVLIYALDAPEAIQHAMQHDADLLHEWLCRNVLSVNTVKTCYMTFGRARNIPDLNVIIDGTEINRVNKFKYLGLVIDDDLTFNKHVNHIKKQITPFISLMWRKGKYIPVDKRKQLYFAYVQSHLLYMLPIYGDCARYKLNELQTLQNRCIKAVYRLDRYTSTTYLYSTSLLPVIELAKAERIVCIHKLVCSLTKHNFRFSTNADVHGRTLRRGSRIHNFNMQSTVTTFSNSSNAALALAINEYNSVDSDIRHLTSLNTFKAKVKLKIMQNSEEYNVISPYYFIN